MFSVLSLASEDTHYRGNPSYRGTVPTNEVLDRYKIQVAPGNPTDLEAVFEPFARNNYQFRIDPDSNTLYPNLAYVHPSEWISQLNKPVVMVYDAMNTNNVGILAYPPKGGD